MQRVPEAASPKAERKPVSLRRIRSVAVVMTCLLVLGGAALIVAAGVGSPLPIIFFLLFALPYTTILWRLRGGAEKRGLRLAMATGMVGFGGLSVPALLITWFLIGEGTKAFPDRIPLAGVILFSGTLAGLHWILCGNAKKAYEAAWPEEGRQRQSKWNAVEWGVLVLLVLLLLAVVIPNSTLFVSRMAVNEASAAGSLRSINTLCVTYSSTYGGFPPTLAALVPPAPGAAPSAAAANLLDSALAAGTKSGYTFTYTAGAAVAGSIPTYTINADPVTPGTTGQRSFFTDQSGIIRADPAAKATVASTPI